MLLPLLKREIVFSSPLDGRVRVRGAPFTLIGMLFGSSMRVNPESPQA